MIKQIRIRFPEEALETDKWFIERGYDQEEIEKMTYAWVESFADCTKEAVLRHNAKKVRELTGFMAEQYLANSDSLKGIIDVAYAENIMWGVEDKDKRWAWPHIAREIQQLYEAMWGVPRSK